MPWTKPITPDSDHTDSRRQLSFKHALLEASESLLTRDERVFFIGEGIDDASGVFGSTLGLADKFGKERILDSPLSENGIMGVTIGSALTGMRPIFVHMRCDFLIIALDQILNHAAKWTYMSNGAVSLPLTIRAVIGRGWGSAAQHAQAVQALLAHLPGIKVVMPSTAYDAKGLLLAAVQDPNPVVLLEHRWLFERQSYVPDSDYLSPIGKAKVCRSGNDLTIIGTSLMVHEAMHAAQELSKDGIEPEIIDLITVNPMDTETILDSVRKTGRVLIADTGHLFCGISAEISAMIAENCFNYLFAPPVRIGWPDVPVPASPVLESYFYPKFEDIIEASKKLMKGS